MQVHSVNNSIIINYQINPQSRNNISFGCAPKQFLMPKGQPCSYIKSLYEQLKGIFSQKFLKLKKEKTSEPIFNYINQPRNYINGTILNGARPLPKFWVRFNEYKKNQLLEKGISTNCVGEAYALLKSSADTPLSTSYVEDCSVVYLFNRQKQTHFLYHLYPEMPKEEFWEVLDKFVSEGYSKACIVPGDQYHRATHKSYLPEIIALIRKREPNANVKLYYSRTSMPEIVGYKGNIYEIVNKNYDGYHDCGQASFKISDILSYEVFEKIDRCKTKEAVEKLRIEFKNENYDEAVNSVIDKLLNEKAEHLQ